ncbi:hypothetical protein F5X96DRAFT_644916 [Biscogniauxia mediterranea]|nr:hypothetical protein F5X96DRAFT_644916 [Biscogniauxia mediterranea]
MNRLPAYIPCVSLCASGGQKGWNRRVKRFFATAIILSLFISALLTLTSKYYSDATETAPKVDIVDDAGRREPPKDDGPHRPEYFEWETTSAFSPVAQDIAGSSIEQLCNSFPQHLLEAVVQPVLKMGSTEDRNKIEAQLESISACIQDLLIFSDLDESLHGRQVIDILEDLPAAYHFENDDFGNYTYLRQFRSKFGVFPDEANESRAIDGWRLDKYKFLPMIERAWTMRPDKRWYFFYETDTYVVWDTLFRFLENLDHETPLYIGSASPGRLEDPEDPASVTWFANGGPGFVLSRAAMARLLHRETGRDGDYLEPSLSHRWLELLRHDPCGDSILGWALRDVGITLSGFWPMFNPYPLRGIPFSQPYWCQPVLTMHKTEPEDMIKLWKWEHGRRAIDRPMTYRDLYDFHHKDRPFYLEDWDNAGGDGHRGPRVGSFAECGKACGEDMGCLQYNWHLGNCTFINSIRYGEHRAPEIPTDAPMSPNGHEWTYEASRFMSGWSAPKIAQWYNEHQCETVQWVRPSLTRIF